MSKSKVKNVRFISAIELGNDCEPLKFIGVSEEDIRSSTATSIDGCIPELTFDYANNRLEILIGNSGIIQLVPMSAISVITIDKKDFDASKPNKKTISRRAKA